MDSFFSIFSALRWQDAVDILLNSYILFRIYVIFRGTHMFRILLGIGILFFFQRLSVSQGLIITSWVFQGLTAVSALIIIVVFRNEIYSILQTRNIRTLFWGIHSPRIRTSREILVESLFELAQKKKGALIVLPGKDDLKEIIQTGLAWNGTISKEMILSIFWPNNPVHDGAIIVEGDKVTQVAAILPLSRRNDLPSYYGTRHRAAAGLTEVTDALVFLVSEERGGIIAAKGNQIQAVTRKQELAMILDKHLGNIVETVQKFNSEKVKVITAAFVSFLIVFHLWLSFTWGNNALITLDIPIQFMNKKAEVQITEGSSDLVRVHLSGATALMKNIRPENVHVELDIKDASFGSNVFQITDKQVKLPPGISVKHIQPREVNVTLDVMKTRLFPVQISWTGKLPENLLLEKAEISPEKIMVAGWSRAIENLSTVYTENVSLWNLKKSGSISVPLAFVHSSIKVASGFPEKIKISYTVKDRTEKSVTE